MFSLIRDLQIQSKQITIDWDIYLFINWWTINTLAPHNEHLVNRTHRQMNILSSSKMFIQMRIERKYSWASFKWKNQVCEPKHIIVLNFNRKLTSFLKTEGYLMKLDNSFCDEANSLSTTPPSILTSHFLLSDNSSDKQNLQKVD